ncbi:hypothetical protein GWK47_046567 [Chionoecetes opilio]|uniref:Uncharacterized protein n=1 Tax=Chionoecetes opilio TaxID=41210 RepID=A0A8J4YBZ7_CHIOP|nr:hypothetical protein GWK47_046567 [Chionoecetes opilio]
MDRGSLAQLWFQLSAILPKPKQSLVSAARNWSQGKEENTTIRRTSQDQDLLSTSLPHIGPKLFNNLPGKLRNLTECSVQKFKHHLDNHLQTIPDEPPVPGYASVSRADTNSISDQVNLQHRDAGYGCSGGAPRLCTREYPQDGNNFIVRPISLKARIHGAIWSYDHRTDMVGSNQIGSALFAATNEQGKDPSSLPLGSRWRGFDPRFGSPRPFLPLAQRMGGNRRGDGLAEQETVAETQLRRGDESGPVLGTAWPSGSVAATVGWGHGSKGGALTRPHTHRRGLSGQQKVARHRSPDETHTHTGRLMKIYSTRQTPVVTT